MSYSWILIVFDWFRALIVCIRSYIIFKYIYCQIQKWVSLSNIYSIEDIVKRPLWLAQRISSICLEWTWPCALLSFANILSVFFIDDQRKSLFCKFAIFLLDWTHSLHILQQQFYWLFLTHVHLTEDLLLAFISFEFANADVTGKDQWLNETRKSKVLSILGKGSFGVQRGRQKRQMIMFSIACDFVVDKIELRRADKFGIDLKIFHHL